MGGIFARAIKFIASTMNIFDGDSGDTVFSALNLDGIEITAFADIAFNGNTTWQRGALKHFHRF